MGGAAEGAEGALDAQGVAQAVGAGVLEQDGVDEVDGLAGGVLDAIDEVAHGLEPGADAGRQGGGLGVGGVHDGFHGSILF